MDIENDNLWLLLHWHALHEKSFDMGKDTTNSYAEIICFKMGKAKGPNLWCQVEEVALMLEKAKIRVDIDLVDGYSYTSSLVVPCKRISFGQRSFTWNEVGKNSTDTSLVVQNWKIEIRFVFMFGT